MGRQPTALLVDKTTNRVFVANRGSGTVSVLDDQTGTVLHAVVSASIASRQFRGGLSLLV